MVRIYQYQKTSDEFTQYLVQGDNVCELCTIDGVTYISVEEGLPEHSDLLTVAETVLTDEIREQIKAASPHVALINSRVVEMIRRRYSVDDELGVIRTAPSAEAVAYNDYVEECRAWGRGEKATLGLA